VPIHPAPSPTGTDAPYPRDLSAPIPELVALGQRITAAREARGLNLQELAARLRMGPEQLQALEIADTKHLPELVFVIAHLRRVAEILEMDVEEAVAALRASASARSAGITAAPAGPRRPDVPLRQAPSHRRGSPPTAGSKTAWPLLAGSFMLIGTAAVGLGVLWHRAATSPSGTGQPTTLSRADFAATAGGANYSPATRAPAPAGPGRLLLRSKEPSWLEVRDGEGATLFAGTLVGEKSFPLGQGLRVMAGRPDLVHAELAGQEPRVLGPIDQVIWRSFAASPGSAAAAGERPALPKTPAP